jgi:hypothetical protein
VGPEKSGSFCFRAHVGREKNQKETLVRCDELCPKSYRTGNGLEKLNLEPVGEDATICENLGITSNPIGKTDDSVEASK